MFFSRLKPGFYALLVFSSGVSHALDCAPSTTIASLLDLEQTYVKQVAVDGVSDDKSVNGMSRVLGVISGFNDGSETSGTLLDFVSRWSVAGAIKEDENQEGTFLVDFNHFLWGGSDKNIFDGKLRGVVNTNAKISEGLGMALKDAGQESRISELEKELDGFDDYKLSWTYNFDNDRIGQNINRHRYVLSQLARNHVETQAAALLAEYVAEGKLLTKLLNEHAIKYDWSEKEAHSKPLSALEPAESDQVCVFARRLEELGEQFSESVSQSARMMGIGLFGPLLKSQPQMTLEVSQRVRDAKIGPDESAVSLTYSTGVVNLNSFRKQSNDICRNGDADECAQSYRAFLEQNGFNPDSIDTANVNPGEFKFGLTYSDVSDHEFVDTSGVSYRKDGEGKVTWSIAYGLNLELDEDGAPKSKFELGVNYEDYLDNNQGNDRFVTDLKWTKKSNGIEFPLILTYANKSEFLPEDSDQLSARIAIKYRFW